MEPTVLGKKYDNIAQWWHDRHVNSDYGVEPFKRALNFCTKTGTALDVGCGAGGRFIRILQEWEFSVVGIDVSKQMIEFAKQNHPKEEFHVQDICDYETDKRFDFILAWDSIFHLPFSQQEPVVTKLCQLLAKDGVLIYTFGDDVGEHEDQWHDDTFYYSSIGIAGNLTVLEKNGITCKHLEFDQWPQNHVYLIGVKS